VDPDPDLDPRIPPCLGLMDPDPEPDADPDPAIFVIAIQDVKKKQI
jgi:hypothetical protein